MLIIVLSYSNIIIVSNENINKINVIKFMLCFTIINCRAYSKKVFVLNAKYAGKRVILVVCVVLSAWRNAIAALLLTVPHA